MAQEPVKDAVSLHPHWGHASLLKTLARAKERDSLPASLLIQGPKGVGKQHLALWLGRLLLCSAPKPAGPCEECPSCKMALKLEHPDLHWYFPLPRPKNASTPEKLARALEAARWETLKEIREDPLKPLTADGARSLYLAAARTLRKQAQRRPSMGDRQIFLIAEAEMLSPKDSSSEAANALLKLLEEPPEGTSLILTSGEPGRLLPTILSRTTHLHLPPLSTQEVTDFLVEVKGLDLEEAQRLGTLSQGAIGRALRLLPDGGDEGSLEKVRCAARALLTSALAPTSSASYKTALEFKTTGSRGLMELFEFLEEWLRDLAHAAQGAPARTLNPGSEAFFKEALTRWTIRPQDVAQAIERVDEARVLAAGNANPQLVVFGLLNELRETLIDAETPSRPRS
jgi:DNA polymerase-3 subunit delta'